MPVRGRHHQSGFTTVNGCRTLYRIPGNNHHRAAHSLGLSRLQSIWTIPTIKRPRIAKGFFRPKVVSGWCVWFESQSHT